MLLRLKLTPQAHGGSSYSCSSANNSGCNFSKMNDHMSFGRKVDIPAPFTINDMKEGDRLVIAYLHNTCESCKRRGQRLVHPCPSAVKVWRTALLIKSVK